MSQQSYQSCNPYSYGSVQTNFPSSEYSYGSQWPVGTAQPNFNSRGPNDYSYCGGFESNFNSPVMPCAQQNPIVQYPGPSYNNGNYGSTGFYHSGTSNNMPINNYESFCNTPTSTAGFHYASPNNISSTTSSVISSTTIQISHTRGRIPNKFCVDNKTYDRVTKKLIDRVATHKIPFTVIVIKTQNGKKEIVDIQDDEGRATFIKRIRNSFNVVNHNKKKMQEKDAILARNAQLLSGYK